LCRPFVGGDGFLDSETLRGVPKLRFLAHARVSGFVSGLSARHKRHIRHIRVVLLGVREEYRATAAAAALYASLIHEGTRLNYLGAECSWVLEDNVLMKRAIESMGGNVYKTYRIYEWE
jgi:hypothetical protein